MSGRTIRGIITERGYKANLVRRVGPSQQSAGCISGGFLDCVCVVDEEVSRSIISCVLPAGSMQRMMHLQCIDAWKNFVNRF